MLAGRGPLPRPFGRGLIEALVPLWLARRGVGTFRDRSVAASLKPSYFLAPRISPSGLPRPFGRGLIEAAAVGLSPGFDPQPSATVRSRPH